MMQRLDTPLGESFQFGNRSPGSGVRLVMHSWRSEGHLSDCRIETRDGGFIAWRKTGNCLLLYEHCSQTGILRLLG